jgi:HPt (histidine-containing phosphotransfer) domain-containing protein
MQRRCGTRVDFLPDAEAPDERGVATQQVSTFDPQALWRALSNDAELVAARLAVFLVRWHRLVRRVHVAIDALDLDAIEQYAHAMRSSLQTMSASALSATASDLEAAALEGDVERVRQVATRLDAEAPLLVRDVRFVIDHIVE